MKQQNTLPPVMQDLLFERLTSISKARAYDIVSEQVMELKADNEQLKERCRVLTEALQAFKDVLIHKDGEIEGNKARTNIIKHCPDMRDVLNEIRNKKLLDTK